MAKVFWGVLLALLTFSAITTVLFFLGVIGFASAVNQAAEQNAQQVHAAMVAEHQAQVRQQQLRAFRQAEDLRRRTLGVDERFRGSSYTQQLSAWSSSMPAISWSEMRRPLSVVNCWFSSS